MENEMKGVKMAWRNDVDLLDVINLGSSLDWQDAQTLMGNVCGIRSHLAPAVGWQDLIACNLLAAISLETCYSRSQVKSLGSIFSLLIENQSSSPRNFLSDLKRFGINRDNGQSGHLFAEMVFNQCLHLNNETLEYVMARATAFLFNHLMPV